MHFLIVLQTNILTKKKKRNRSCNYFLVIFEFLTKNQTTWKSSF